jgi:2-oxoglutarate dehydrogenase E2 component (dihydrolipoamide succinyltransferase)
MIGRRLVRLGLRASLRQAVSTKSRATFVTHVRRSGYIAQVSQMNLSKKTRLFSSAAISTETLESLGDSITTAVLLQWAKEPGDWVSEDDVVGVVETDKVTMDIRAKKDGLFVKGLCAAGDEINVGADLYQLDTAASGPVASSEATEEKEIPPPKTDMSVARLEVEVPIMGESITTGTLSEWTVGAGDYVDADQVVAMIETDKVTVEVRAPQAGALLETYAEDGAEIEVGKPLFALDTNAVGTSSASSKAEEAAPVAASAPVSTPTPASTPAPAAKPAPTPSAPVVAPAPEGDRSETRVKMTRMRVRIAQRLKESQNTAAMLTTFQEVDMGPLIEMRNKYKEEFLKTHNVKLGFMSAFVRASTTALQELPAVNGVIDDATNEIVYRNYVDISVAVASPTGLVVPVLRNTEKMTFADVEKTIGMYGAKAKEGNLALEDMAGGTFTISNGGVFGSLFGTPIINPPQSAILGMHATKMRPMVMSDGSIEARPVMYLALTYDHRLIDGREAVTFLKTVQNKIEDPSRLLLEL